MKWRLQFSIKSLMFCLVLIGMALGWWIDHRRAAVRILELEGQVQRATHILDGTQETLGSSWYIDYSYSLSNGNATIQERDGTKTRWILSNED